MCDNLPREKIFGLLERGECCSEGKAATYPVVLLGTQQDVALSGGMMKRKIFKTLETIEKKFALCLMLTGLAAMNTGFTTEQEEPIPEPTAVEVVEETSADVPTAIAVDENGKIKVGDDDELTKAFAETVERAKTQDLSEKVDEPNENPEPFTDEKSETEAADVSTIQEVEPEPVDERPRAENLIETSRGWVRYTEMMSLEATAYLPTDGSPEGLTAMGIPATYGIVAVDPDIIPLGSRVYIPGYGEALAADTGGAIVGYRIDLCMESYDEAMDFGRRNVTVFVLK